MSKQRQRRILLACGLAILLIAYWHEQSDDDSPSFTACLDDISNANVNRAKAQYAIRSIGTNDLPLLLRHLSYEISTNDFKHRLSYAFDKLPHALLPERLIHWAHSDREGERAAAALRVFHSLGEQAGPAIPELTQLLNEPDVPTSSWRAFAALTFIGRDSIPVIAAFLSNTNDPSRRYLARSLYYEWLYSWNYQWSDIGRPSNALSVPLLLSCLAGPNPREASQAALLLGVLVSTYPLHAGMFVTALSNSPPTVRLTAVRVLGQSTTNANRVVPILLPLTKDADERVRGAAIEALQVISQEALTNASAE